MRENATGAGNQQETKPRLRIGGVGSSETIRQAPFSKTEIVAYLQGALHDASINKKRRYRFTQKGTEWLFVLKELFAILGYRAWMYREGADRDVYALETTARFLDFHSNPLTFASRTQRRAYVRGFFDAEGGIPQNTSARFYIQLTQKDKKKIKALVKILSEENIGTGKIHNPSAAVDANYWRVFVLAQSHKDFIATVDSWHPRKRKLFRERVKI